MTEISHKLASRFFERARKLFLHDGSEMALQIGKEPVDADLLEEWGAEACGLLGDIRYSANKQFYEKSDDVFAIVKEVATRLEKIANYFDVLLNQAHVQIDETLAEVYWHLLGNECHLERADGHYRRTGKSADEISQIQRVQGRSVSEGSIAERYLDGVGTDKDIAGAMKIFGTFLDFWIVEGENDTAERISDHESYRLFGRYEEIGSPHKKAKRKDAVEIARDLWTSGYIPAGADLYRLEGSLPEYSEEAEYDILNGEDEEDDDLSDDDADRVDELDGLSKAEIKELLDAELVKLYGMVGLHAVKKEVAKLVAYEDMKSDRLKAGFIEKDPPSRHLVFVGNPGTGKTSVAEILAKVYRLLGVLKKNVFVKTNQAGLIGSYVGQTAPKTEKVIKSARGGMLFIDEAYGLTSEHGGDYGQEAVNILLNGMEDYRAELIVVVAGYRKQMDHFLDSNPGLRSRFSRTLDFEDYTPTERVEVLQRIAANKGYAFNDGAKNLAAEFFVMSLASDEAKGNGRFVRKFCECCIDFRSLRNTQMKSQKKRRTPSSLAIITAVDAFNAAQEFGVAVAPPIEHDTSVSGKRLHSDRVKASQGKEGVPDDKYEPNVSWPLLRPIHIRHTTIGVLL